MQSMIRVNRGSKTYRVFFDSNLDTQDFENIRIRDEKGEPPLALTSGDIESLKDLIAQEVILATLTAANFYKGGEPVVH